jgi:3-methyladenine DNA glycosylase AlkD
VTAREIRKILRRFADSARAEHSQRFFKTGKGEYGEGDKFLGIRVPVLRKEARKYRSISCEEISRLLRSSFHEERLCALLLLVDKFKKAHAEERTLIYELYLGNIKYINNWDLVDSSAHHIVGAYLENKDKQPLYDLAASECLWERRIAIMSTFHLIRKNEFEAALKVSSLLKDDEEDLIHKAVGWMLREIGKRNLAVERAFLKAHYKSMPRTMLRYAIEKFPEKDRQMYLRGTA